MIPKIIHYCWFGRGEKNALAIKCIESWKKVLPDYELKEWNEDNFDVSLYPYAKEALENRKFAFVTDVVRLYALYHVRDVSFISGRERLYRRRNVYGKYDYQRRDRVFLYVHLAIFQPHSGTRRTVQLVAIGVRFR